jgi:hypothetical protein
MATPVSAPLLDRFAALSDPRQRSICSLAPNRRPT